MMEVKGPPKDSYEQPPFILPDPPDLVASMKATFEVKGGTVVISAKTKAAGKQEVKP